MAPIRTYTGDGVTEYIPGVPARDLEQEDWDAQPEHIEAQIDASAFYEDPGAAPEGEAAPAGEAAATEEPTP